MNELYKLTIESAELELAVTEGFVDKAKSTVSKIIEKLKAFIKKFIVFIKDKCTKFIKFVEKMASKLAHLTEMDDKRMIDVPYCISIDASSKVLVKIDKKVKGVIAELERDADVNEDNLNYSEERYVIENTLLRESKKITVAEAKKEIKTILNYIHNRNDNIAFTITGLSNDILKLEKSVTNSNTQFMNKKIAVIQKLIAIERYILSYNNKTLEKCLILVKKIGNKKIKDEVETSKKIQDRVTKPVLN